MEQIYMISPLQDSYEIPVQRNAIYPETFPLEETHPKPILWGYQLLGDSLFLRFSEKILEQPSTVVNGSRSVGYCVSGQRIDQLRKKIKANDHPLTENVMILIGTNDVLCGGEPEVMIKHFKRLLRLLKKKSVKKLVIITLPPIPKLCVCFRHWAVLRMYNDFLMSLKEEKSMDIEVLDVLPIFTKFKPALSFAITEDHLTLRRSNSLDRNSSSDRNSGSEKNNSLERINHLESRNTLERNNSLERGNTLERSKSLEKGNSLTRTNSLGRRNSLERRIRLEMPVTPISRESSVERKKSIGHVEVTAKQNVGLLLGKSVKNEYTSPAVSPKEGVKKNPERVKCRVASRKIVADYSSDSNHENKSDSSSAEETPNPEIFRRAQEIKETPTIAKGTKRLLDTDDGDTISAFNNSLNRGSSKRRKIEYVSPEPSSRESKPLKKSPDSTLAQKNIFLKALKDITQPASPEKKVKTMPNFKPEPEKQKNETLVSLNDSWRIDTDEENLGNFSYHSQDEEEVNCSNEKRDTGNEKFRERFSEYINSTNESNLVSLQAPDKRSCFFWENQFENDADNAVKSRTRDDLSEGEIEDDSSEDEAEDDLLDDDDKKSEAEAEVESEVTTDDGTPKRQIPPYIETKFLKFLSINTHYMNLCANESNGNYLHSSYCSELPGYRNPNERFLSAPAVPSFMESFAYGGSPRGPYLHSLTPPSSVPPTPPQMTANGLVYESQTSPYDSLTDRDKDVIEHSKRICETDCYEMFYSLGNKRMDMIHLNHTGLYRLLDFIKNHHENIF